MKLETKYKEILEKAKPSLVKARFYDLRHSEISTEYMQEILEGENKEHFEGVLIPAIILHDIGWSKLGEDKNTSWDKEEMRIKHMEEGAKIAKLILEELEYPQNLADEIVDLVANHDNIYIGIEPKSEKEKILRDGDACFILTDLSFWKDYHVKNKGESPLDFLNGQVEKYGKRYTKSAQMITDKQIEDRKQEIMNASITPNERFNKLKKQAEDRNKEVLSKN